MKKILYISILMLLVTGCQSQKKIVSVSKETNQFSMRKGQYCEIMFRTNASTGFWWQLMNEDEITIVESAGDRYESDAPKVMVGASSNRYWKFHAIERGTQTLKFVYARDNQQEAIRTREVTITVK
ncbi:MAG: protease inhibitor I42 family protein [Bacteroidales bacterium]|nr:protease inhibitor I42 family protein [Bacteroidales bacterium]